jgi:hypothetical protein
LLLTGEKSKFGVLNKSCFEIITKKDRLCMDETATQKVILK